MPSAAWWWRCSTRRRTRLPGTKHASQNWKSAPVKQLQQQRAPSSDGLKRTRSLRSNPGGQPGHPGRRLCASPTPDVVIDMPLEQCPQCQNDLGGQPVQSGEARQVFKLRSSQVARHRMPCGAQTLPALRASFHRRVPRGGGRERTHAIRPSMQAVMSHLQAWQLPPHGRAEQVCEDLFGHRRPSAGGHRAQRGQKRR